MHTRRKGESLPAWTALALVLTGFFASAAQAQPSPRWAVAPMAESTVRGAAPDANASGSAGADAPKIDAESRETYRQLFSDALLRKRIEVVPLTPTCGETRCAFEAAQGAGAPTLVKLELRRLGNKVIARAERWKVAPIALERAEHAEVDGTDELEKSATELAAKLTDDVDARTAAPNAAGAPPPPPRGGRAARPSPPAPTDWERGGLSLTALGSVPIRPSSEGDTGVGMNVGYWFETPNFVIEPRIGLHGIANNLRTRDVPMEVGAYWLPLEKSVTPFIGAAAGIHYRSERRPGGQTVGSVLVAESEGYQRDSAWGMGLTLRGGLVFLRHHDVRLTANLEYSTSFLKLHGVHTPQSLRMGVGVLF